MDVADQAQIRTEHFTKLAMQNRHFDLAPMPAQNTDPNGFALCIDCDIDITERRKVLPSTQRCTECQTDHEKRSRK